MPKIKNGLFVVATPIGNLGDMSARAQEILTTVDKIACEDTRVTGKLLSRFSINTPMIVYHDHNAGKIRPGLLADLEARCRHCLSQRRWHACNLRSWL